ncbi:PD-(D/E)XK nuclease family transposase, partial [Sphingobacterium faecale]
DKANNAKYYYSAKIVDQFDQEVLYEKLSYKMLVLPNFNKSKTELSTIMDQWMYLMKHLNEIDELPNYLDKRIFSCIFEVGEVANLSPAEQMAYISSLDRKRDYNNTIAFAKKEAMAEGERKKALETALNLKNMDIPLDKIAKATGLRIEEIEHLK